MSPNRTKGFSRILLYSLIFLSLSFFISLFLGGARLSLSELLSGLFLKSEIEGSIIWKIRIPRIILGLIVGCGLSASGCALQGILRNPLAEPYTLGISGGAALGYSIGAILGVEAFSLPIFAFIGAMGSIFFIFSFASQKNFSAPTLILVGVILNFITSALVLLLFIVLHPEKLYPMMLWLMGELSLVDFNLVKITVGLIFVGIIFLILFSRDIDILTLGEEKATHLGVDSNRALKIIFLITSLIAGACIATSGMIGFVGLMIPHIARRFVGPMQSKLIPISILAGAGFLCLADALAKTIIYPLELPVGVITGIFGGIFFLSILLKTKEWIFF